MKSDKGNTIYLWDKHWNESGPDLLKARAVDENSWYNLVWRVGLEYWKDIFNRLAKGKEMLECGAGSAKQSLYMAKEGYSCTMLDNSPNGLKLARMRFEQEGLSGKFILGDVTKMPFEDETFDIVTSGGLLQHFRDIEPPIREMMRVLKKGGLCTAVVVPKKFSCQTIGEMEYFLVRFIKNLIKGKFKGIISESKNKFPFYVNSFSLKKYVNTFESAGLRNITATGLCPFPSLALPKFANGIYVNFMRRLIPLWKRFDRSNLRFTEIWGISFSIYGFKK